MKGGRGKGGLIYCRELGEVQCKESQRQGPDLNGRRWGWGRWGHCLHLGLKYEKQKIVRSKKQTNKKAQEEWGIKFCPPARSALTPVQTLLGGPLHLPSSSSWVPLSLCPSLSGILCLSLHPLLQRHAKAVGSLRRVWGSARAVRGCYLGLLQQTGSSSPRGRGERKESESRSAQPVRNHICIPAEREKGKLQHRKEKTAERE